jgi:hypothetical protein
VVERLGCRPPRARGAVQDAGQLEHALFAPRSEVVEGDTPVQRLESETGGRMRPYGWHGEPPASILLYPPRKRSSRDTGLLRGSFRIVYIAERRTHWGRRRGRTLGYLERFPAQVFTHSKARSTVERM